MAAFVTGHLCVFVAQDLQMPHRLLLVSTSDHTVRLTVQEYSRQEIVELLPPLTPPSIPTPPPFSTLQSKAAAQAFLSFVSGETDEHLPNSEDTEAVWKPTSLQSADARSEGGTSGQVRIDANVVCAQPGSVYIVENTLNSDNVRETSLSSDRAGLTAACHVAQSISLCSNAPSKTGSLATTRNTDSMDEGNRSLQDCRSSPVPLTLVVQDETQRGIENLRDSIPMPTKVGCDPVEGSNTISCDPKEGLHGDSEGARPRKRKKEEDKSDRIDKSPRPVAWKGGEKDIFSMLLGGSENEDLF